MRKPICTEVCDSVRNPVLGSKKCKYTKPFCVVYVLKKASGLTLVFYIPGSCNCKTPKETYNSLSKHTKKPAVTSRMCTSADSGSLPGFLREYSHPATVMDTQEQPSQNQHKNARSPLRVTQKRNMTAGFSLERSTEEQSFTNYMFTSNQ